MLNAVGRGTSAALDADRWLITKEMGPALLEVIHAQSDWYLYKRYDMALPSGEVPPEGPHEDEVLRIRGGTELELARKRDEGTWVIDLPHEGSRVAMKATCDLDDPPGVMTLFFGTGDPSAYVHHAEKYHKVGDDWVPVKSSPTGRIYEPGTLIHRAFDELVAAASNSAS
jgi:hypothetical protein